MADLVSAIYAAAAKISLGPLDFGKFRGSRTGSPVLVDGRVKPGHGEKQSLEFHPHVAPSEPTPCCRKSEIRLRLPHEQVFASEFRIVGHHFRQFFRDDKSDEKKISRKASVTH
jgi:hypothetical protein